MIWKKSRNIIGMPPKNFRKISHPEQEISLYKPNFSKEVSQLTDWQTYKKIRIIWNKCINIPGMPPRKFRRISHPLLEIYLYWPNFSKEISQLTDWKTYKKFGITQKKSRNILGMSPNNSRMISRPKLEISLYWPNFRK